MFQSNNFRFLSQQIQYKDYAIQTYSFGSGENVIFSLPSYPHSGLYYIFFTSFYNESKYKFITFDLPGWAGWSDNIFENGKFNIDDVVGIAETVLKYYKVEKFSIIGYSFGGACCIKIANKMPEKINKIVLVSTIVNGTLIKYNPIKRMVAVIHYSRIYQAVKSFIMFRYGQYKHVLDGRVSKSLVKEYEKMLGNSNRKVLIDSVYWLFNSDLTEDLKRLRSFDGNILVVNSGTEDPIFKQQSRYIRHILDHSNHLKITGSHEDFILHPQSETVKKVMNFLTT